MPELRGVCHTEDQVTRLVQTIRDEGYTAEVWECPRDWASVAPATWHVYRLDIPVPDVATRSPFELIDDPLPTRPGTRPWEKS